MKASLKWLNKYADLSGISAEEIAGALPMLGLEVESVETLGLKPLDRVVVGEILSREPHPDSDHLGVCMVKVSPDSDPIQIVCGASNYKVGDRVPVALSGAKLPTEDGKGFEIKVSKLRGVESNGMMCSARELGLGQDHSGLLILESRPEIGTPINDVFTDSDTVFEIELTANRGDCLSHIGIARELAAKFGRQLKKPELKYAPKYSAAPAVISGNPAASAFLFHSVSFPPRNENTAAATAAIAASTHTSTNGFFLTASIAPRSAAEIRFFIRISPDAI